MLLPSFIQIQKINHFTGHAAGIFSLAQGFAQHEILSGGGDGVIAAWQVGKQENAKGLASIAGNVFALKLVPEMQLLVAGDLNGVLHIINLESKLEVARFTYEGGAIFSIVLIDNNNILVGAGNGNAYIIDLTQLKQIAVIEVSDKSIRAVCYIANRREFLFACSDFNIYVYDADNFQLKNVLHGHDNSVFSIALNPSGTRLVSGSRDAQLKVWDVQNNYTCLMTIPAHMFTINDIVFSPDGKLMATAGRDKHIKIWDAEAFNLLKVIDREKFGGHINSVNKLFWSNWNNYLISCGDDKAVMVWEIIINEEGM